MTKQQFESYGFAISTKIEYKGTAYHLIGVDFDSGLLEISEIDPKSDVHLDDDDRIFVLYYVCDIIPAPMQSVNYAENQLTPQITAMYLGCEAIGKNSRHGERRFILESVGLHHVSDGDRIFYRADEIKLVLRPLDSITEKENAHVQAIVDSMGAVHDAVSMAEITAYLTSKHFDLFGLINAGLAVEKNK